jgi:prenyltransferase beta subunit
VTKPDVTADDQQRSRGPVATTRTDLEVGTRPDSTDRSQNGATANRRVLRTMRRPARSATPLTKPDRNLNTLAKRDANPSPLSLDKPPRLVNPDRGPQPTIRQPAATRTVRPRRNAVAPTYQLRNLAERQNTARRFGGTAASEQAVERSLNWLASVQNPAGYWDADRYGSGKVQFDENRVDRMYAGIHSDTGITALAILAFLGAGYTHEIGPYTTQVDRGLQWLVKQQKSDGNLCGNATHFARMYCHAMATYAMAEAYGMQSDATTDVRLRRPLERAIRFIINNQHSESGGWRYRRGQAGDTSMFGWQLMALKSAEIAGLKIPTLVKQRMYTFLKKGSRGADGGLAAYRQGEAVTETMTAEALFCKQMLGIQRSNPACVEAVDYLLQHVPSRSNLNLYYWYYGTLAMYQHGGAAWRTWNERVRDLLIAEQHTSGAQAGSWDPYGRWGSYGGRIYSTALSTLCLEVYYRFLPLYKMGGRYDNQ